MVTKINQLGERVVVIECINGALVSIIGRPDVRQIIWPSPTLLPRTWEEKANEDKQKKMKLFHVVF